MKTAKAILFSAVSLLTLVLSSEGVQTTKPATLWGTGAMASCASAIGNFPNKVPYLNPYCTDVSDYGARDNVARLWTDNYQPPFSAGIYFGDNCPSGYWSNGRVCILYPAPPAVDAQKNLGNPSSCRELAGNPIHVGTGNKLLTEIDYQGSGAYPLAFVRYYNSMTNKSGPLGANWRSNYDRSLVISSSEPDKAWTQRPDGKILYFNKVGGVWTPDSDVVANLVEMANLTGWQLTIGDDDEREVYDASGKLLSIHNRTGLSHTLSYDNEGRLVSVNDPFGRSLSFGYDNSDRITTITDPAGNVTSYTYASITNNVVSVTYPGRNTCRQNLPLQRTCLHGEHRSAARADRYHRRKQ